MWGIIRGNTILGVKGARMQDMEIESLLEDAGYRFNIVDGVYFAGDEEDGDTHGSEDVADQLEIPMEDLLRWEEQQRQADTAVGD